MEIKFSIPCKYWCVHNEHYSDEFWKPTQTTRGLYITSDGKIIEVRDE